MTIHHGKYTSSVDRHCLSRVPHSVDPILTYTDTPYFIILLWQIAFAFAYGACCYYNSFGSFLHGAIQRGVVLAFFDRLLSSAFSFPAIKRAYVQGSGGNMYVHRGEYIDLPSVIQSLHQHSSTFLRAIICRVISTIYSVSYKAQRKRYNVNS